MTKNGQYTFWNEEEQGKVWRKGWRWGYVCGVITLFTLLTLGILCGYLVDTFGY